MKRLLDTLLRTATVEHVEPLAGSFRAITLTGTGIHDLDVKPGQQIRVQVGAANPVLDLLVGALRTYSIWEYDRTRMHLRILDHGEGPGAQWARRVRPGEEIRVFGPEGSFVSRPSDYHLFAGDETAAVAFGAIIRGLDDGAPVHAAIEVDTEQDRLPIPGEITWIHRNGRSAVKSADLVAAVANLDLPKTPGTAYLAGEAGTIQMVREHLIRDRGWHRRSIVTKPFWAPGRVGLD